MIKECNNKEIDIILGYIGKDYHRCLYLYMDVIKYGCASETTRTWLQFKDEKICAVLLAYHTALHIFSRNNDFDAIEICNLVNDVKPTLVNATAETIKKLEPFFTQSDFSSEFGHIGEWNGTPIVDSSIQVEEAVDNDIPQVAKMLYDDEDIGASYTYDDLLNQMRERLKEGFVRSFVVREDEKVIAHLGTGAEMDGLCTISYGITASECRGRGIASVIFSKVCNLMQSEGKRVFSIYYPENARQFHHKMGFVDICEYGKLFKKME